MKKIYIIFFVLIFYSCTIPYDLETRYIIETKLIDLNGNAIANEKFSIYVSTNISSSIIYGGNSGETISNSISDENGNIRFIFPKPDVEYFTFLMENNSNGNYYHKVISNIKEENFIDYKLNLNEIKLVKFDEITSLLIEVNQINQDKELRKIEIIGQVYNENEYLNPIDVLENYNYPQTYFTLLKNQNFTLKYTIYNYSTMLLEETLVNLNVTDQPIEYLLNY